MKQSCVDNHYFPPPPKPAIKKQIVTNYPEGKGLTSHASELCPEKYGGMYARPYCLRGYDTLNCTTNSALSHLVTVVLNFVTCSENKCGNIQTILSSIISIQFYPQSKSKSYPRVIIAASENINESTVQKQYPELDIRLYHFASTNSAGKVWNTLIKQVKTPYILLAPDITELTNDSRIDRLVRETGLLHAHFVGGSVRTVAGHWFPNCLQSNLSNFRLSFKTGYVKSKHECMYCDYLNSPFLARTVTLRRDVFDESLSPELIFDDFFLRAKKSGKVTVVCPDSMFHVQYIPKSRSRKEVWKPFARKWELNFLSTPDGYHFEYTCDEANLASACARKQTSFMLPPCCVKELANLVLVMLEVCQTHNIYCNPGSGTLLGGVKFAGPIFWEKDADVFYDASNYSAFKALGPVFKTRGYRLRETSSNKGNGGSFALYSNHWYIDAWGFKDKPVGPLRTLRNGRKPTKMMFFGKWIPTDTNPAFNCRNRYGYEPYRHHEYGHSLASFTEWLFTPCTKPGAHYCLDQFSPDGNIQFFDSIPGFFPVPQRKDDGNQSV